MTIRILGMAALLGAAGCTTTAADTAAAPGAAGACDPAKVQSYLGQTATPALVGEIQAAAGAGSSRLLPPGSMATMDYRPERLNVEVDAASRITGLRCG